MEVYATLWKHYTKKDGSQRLVIYASKGGLNRYYSTGISVHTVPSRSGQSWPTSV